MEALISINTLAYEGYDLTTALREIAKIGISHVELGFTGGFTEGLTEGHFSEVSAKKIKYLLTDLGLSSIAVAAHTDLTTHEAVDELKRRIDFGNAFTYSKGKIDPALDYQEALPYACHLHLKDLNQEGDSWQFSQIGKGVITYDTILKKLAEEKKMLPLSIEHLFIYNASEDFIVNRLQRPPSLLHISTSLKRSIAYVQDVFKTYR